MNQHTFPDHAAVKQEVLEFMLNKQNLLLRIHHNIIDASNFNVEDKERLHELGINQLCSDDKKIERLMIDLLLITLSEDSNVFTEHHENAINLLREKIHLDDDDEVPLLIDDDE